MQDTEKPRITRARWADILLPLIFALIVAFSFFTLSHNIKSRERALCEGAAVHAASHISASVSAIRLAGERLASALQTNPSLSLGGISTLASGILSQGDHVKGVSVAPNAVIRYHFPESGDQSSIGHDLLSNPERRDALARAMESGQPILSGPEDSMEGGQAVFLRFPVFQAGKIWGFVSVTIDFSRLMNQFLTPGEFPGMAFAVAVKDEGSADTTWSLAAGTEAAYDARGIFASVKLPGTDWHVYAMPERGWSSADPFLYVVCIAGLMAAVFLFFAMRGKGHPRSGALRAAPATQAPRSGSLPANPAAQAPRSGSLPVTPTAQAPRAVPTSSLTANEAGPAIHKSRKEVRFKGQNVKGELYMPDVLLSGDPESLFRAQEPTPVVPAPVAETLLAAGAQRAASTPQAAAAPSLTASSRTAEPRTVAPQPAASTQQQPAAAPSLAASSRTAEPRAAAPQLAASSRTAEPRAAAPQQAASAAKARREPSKQTPLFTLEEEPVKKAPSILVVDDSEANRDIMGRMLSLRGYSADFASSGEEALLKAESRSYDIVFMDCFMPVMDGYQTSSALRSRFAGSGMKIIGISARIGDQEAARCSSAGMDALLAKPFTLKELQTTLEKYS